MSILASLVKAYDRLEMDDKVPIFGYSSQNIHGCIILNIEGQLVGPPALWHKDSKGKKTSRMMNVPYFGGRSGQKPPPYFLWDNTAYVLGVTAKDIDPTSRHDEFKKLHLEALEDADDEELRAVAKFIQNWKPENFEPAGFPDDAKDLNFAFRLESKKTFAHESELAKKIWSRTWKSDSAGHAVCLVTGEYGPILRLHPPLVSFEKQARIVSFNEDAYESYGHDRGENAPVSEVAAFKYSAALNRFLAKDTKENRTYIGDATTVFWASANTEHSEVEKYAEDIFAAMFTDIDESMQARKVQVLLEQIRQGLPIADIAPELAEGVRFHVLGLAPNAARLSIRFWLDNSFGEIAKHYQRFVSDMRIEPTGRDPHPALWKYLAETAVLGKRENVPPNLAGEWMRAILTGTRYPLTLLATVLMRLRADKDVNALRVSILKSILIRNFNREVPVALDPDFKDKGYLLGRLFAVYEHVQSAALGSKVNATIKDKFYGSASAQPRKVFKLLESGSANHLSKVGKVRQGQKVNLEKQIGEIMGLMQPADDPFPASLSTESQALFGLGYYHQRNEFYTSRKDKTTVSEGENQ